MNPIYEKLKRWQNLLRTDGIDSKQIVINEIEETLTKNRKVNYKIVYSVSNVRQKIRYIKSLDGYFKYYKGHLEMHESYYPFKIIDLKSGHEIASFESYNDVLKFMEE